MQNNTALSRSAYHTIEGATAARYMAGNLRDVGNGEPLDPEIRDTLAFMLMALAEATPDRLEVEERATRGGRDVSTTDQD